MNISLTPRLEKLVNKKVSSGLYNSASEVIRAGLRLLTEQDEIRQHRLKELRHDIALGLGEAQKGKLKPLNVKAIRAQVRERAAPRNKA